MDIEYRIAITDHDRWFEIAGVLLGMSERFLTLRAELEASVAKHTLQYFKDWECHILHGLGSRKV